MVRFQNFETERLVVSDWAATLSDEAARAALEARLAQMLTPEVLKDLPPSMQIAPDKADIAGWIDARAAESEVSLVINRQSNEILGLFVLVAIRDAGDAPVMHLGYLFSEDTWGQGYASELIRGVVAKANTGPSSVLMGGVAVDNPASAWVLIKAGFLRDASQSTKETDMFVLRT